MLKRACKACSICAKVYRRKILKTVEHQRGHKYCFCCCCCLKSTPNPHATAHTHQPKNTSRLPSTLLLLLRSQDDLENLRSINSYNRDALEGFCLLGNVNHALDIFLITTLAFKTFANVELSKSRFVKGSGDFIVRQIKMP